MSDLEQLPLFHSTDLAPPQENVDYLKSLLQAKDNEIRSLRELIDAQKKELERFHGLLGPNVRPAAALPTPNKRKPPPLPPLTHVVTAVATAKPPEHHTDAKPKAKEGRKGQSHKPWQHRYQQLVQFKLQYGHCNVPKSYENSALHAWVRKQRWSRKQMDLGLPCEGMNPERIQALDRIGFEWIVGHVPKDAQWEANFQDLINYKTQYGDCNVPSSYPKLGKWVLNQRARRRLLEKNGEGKCKGMTWARVAKLDAVGFSWDGKGAHH